MREADLSHQETWREERTALIACWRRGVALAKENPSLAQRAREGELVELPWRGGVEAPIKGKKYGSHRYLAMWQGLRGDELSMPASGSAELTCAAHGVKVIYLSDQALWEVLPD